MHYEARVTAIESSEGKIKAVTADIGSDTIRFLPANFVSSIPLEFLMQFSVAREFGDASKTDSRLGSASQDSRAGLLVPR